MATDKGVKHDQEKPRLDLVLGAFGHALLEIGKVGTFGAGKYTDNGWLEVPNGIERYTDAMLRHYFAERGEESRDPESELLHASHLAWNALARLELIIMEEARIRVSETPCPPRRVLTAEDLDETIVHGAVTPCTEQGVRLPIRTPPDIEYFTAKSMRDSPKNW